MNGIHLLVYVVNRVLVLHILILCIFVYLLDIFCNKMHLRTNMINLILYFVFSVSREKAFEQPGRIIIIWNIYIYLYILIYVFLYVCKMQVLTFLCLYIFFFFWLMSYATAVCIWHDLCMWMKCNKPLRPVPK